MNFVGSSRCNPLYLRVSSVLIIVSAMSFAASGAQKVRIYPAPKDLDLSSTFEMAVEGSRVPVYNANVIPAISPRVNGRYGVYEHVSYATFDMSVNATVTVTSAKPVLSAKILPTSSGIVPKVQGRTIMFTIAKPQHVTVEINDDWRCHQAQHPLSFRRETYFLLRT